LFRNRTLVAAVNSTPKPVEGGSGDGDASMGQLGHGPDAGHIGGKQRIAVNQGAGWNIKSGKIDDATGDALSSGYFSN